MAAPHRFRSHRFRLPAERFDVRTSDGVRITGSRLGAGDPSVVLLHGFLGWHAKSRPARLAEHLASWFTVYAPDLRGHGRSDGLCTFGVDEIADVEAVVSLARSEGARRVVTVGASMGGTAALRHAALVGGVDGVITISTPAEWHRTGSAIVARLARMISTRRGRRTARVLGARMTDRWDDPETNEDLVGKIAPTPVVIVHGVDDHYFGEEDAWRLYRAAGEPKRLLLASRFGHAEDGFSRGFAERLAREICTGSQGEGAARWSG